MSVDYKTTVFLPKTDFPMKAGLPDLEPKLLERWKQIDLFNQLRQQSKGRQPFVTARPTPTVIFISATR